MLILRRLIRLRHLEMIYDVVATMTMMMVVDDEKEVPVDAWDVVEKVEHYWPCVF